MPNKKEPLNCMSVRIPKYARKILKAEKNRLDKEEDKLVAIGTLAGQYIKKAELLKELVFVSDWINKFISTACDGGDAWCAVRGQEGAKDWADRLNAVITKAKALP